MTKVEKLECEVQNLSPTQLAAFREWFREYDADEWDRQIEEDVRADRMDKLVEEALVEYKAGATKEI